VREGFYIEDMPGCIFVIPLPRAEIMLCSIMLPRRRLDSLHERARLQSWRRLLERRTGHESVVRGGLGVY
jgi:hypothetical protein